MVLLYKLILNNKQYLVHSYNMKAVQFQMILIHAQSVIYQYLVSFLDLNVFAYQVIFINF